MWNKIALFAAALIALAAPPAGANLKNALALCADPAAAAHDVVTFCKRALATGRLDARAEAEVRTNLGVGYYELGRYRDAVAEYDRALALWPELVAGYINRARAQEKLDRLSAAAADYNAAIARDPQAADAYLGRGALLLRHGDPARAAADFSAAIRLAPDWTAPRFNRGLAHLHLGRYGEAAEDFSVVIRQAPGDPGAHLNRGRARAALDRPEAEADFDRAVDLDPEWAGAWFARGQFHDAKGDREAANRDFLRAYELGYRDAWLVQRIREISG